LPVRCSALAKGTFITNRCGAKPCY
jgi:hypothetical protein